MDSFKIFLFFVKYLKKRWKYRKAPIIFLKMEVATVPGGALDHGAKLAGIFETTDMQHGGYGGHSRNNRHATWWVLV